MAETGQLTHAPIGMPAASRVTLVRIAIIATILVIWEATAASGLLFRDVEIQKECDGPLLLAGEDVRDVDFDDRLARAMQRVGERQAGVRERAWIDDDGVTLGAFFLDPIDELTLVV